MITWSASRTMRVEPVQIEKRSCLNKSLPLSRGSQPTLPVQPLAPPRLPFLLGEGASASYIEAPPSIMEGTMRCARCAGLNVPEVIVEGGAKIFAMRCVHCGDVIDHVILMNRQLGRQKGYGQPRTSSYRGNRSIWSRFPPTTGMS